MSRDLGDLAASLGRMPSTLQAAQRDGVQSAALFLTKEMRQSLRMATGGDMRLSGARNRRVNVGYDIVGSANPTAAIRGRGPWRLIEDDTRPHLIKAKYYDIAYKGTRRARRRGRARALAFGGAFYTSVLHPGTSGKKVLATTVRLKGSATTAKYHESFGKALVRGWAA